VPRVCAALFNPPAGYKRKARNPSPTAGTKDLHARAAILLQMHTERQSAAAAAHALPSGVMQSTLNVTFKTPATTSATSRRIRSSASRSSAAASACRAARAPHAHELPPQRRSQTRCGGSNARVPAKGAASTSAAARQAPHARSGTSIPITVLNRRTRCEDRTPLPLTPKEAARLRLHPRVAGAVPWVARTLEACVRPGARGCSPRVVQACGGVRTVASLEFGRCVDAGMSFSSGVSIEMLGAVLASLSSCREWHEVRNWETVDDFRLLCRLPALGESCVVMRNTYPASRTHVNTEHYRSSIESERLLLSARPGAGESAAQAARQEATLYAQRSLQRSTDGAASHGLPVGPSRESGAPGSAESTRQRRAHEAADAVNVSARAVAAATAPSAAAVSHAGGVAQAAVPSSREGATGERTDRGAAPRSARRGRGAGAAHAHAHAHAHVGVSARRARELRAAASATVTAALLARTAETAITEPGPFDVRVRVEREVPVPASALRDLMEPARSDLQLMRTFRIGHAASATTPAWQYEVLLVWVARGVTQAERLQREKPPRCVVRLKLLNAAELLLSGARTVTQLATSMLAKALQLQDTLSAATHGCHVSPGLSTPTLGTPRLATGTPFTVRSGTPAASACAPHTYAAGHGSYSSCSPARVGRDSTETPGELLPPSASLGEDPAAAPSGEVDADTFAASPLPTSLGAGTAGRASLGGMSLVLPSPTLRPGETVIVASEEAFDRVPTRRREDAVRGGGAASDDGADSGVPRPAGSDDTESLSERRHPPRRVASCQAISMSDPGDLAAMTRLPPTIRMT